MGKGIGIIALVFLVLVVIGLVSESSKKNDNGAGATATAAVATAAAVSGAGPGATATAAVATAAAVRGITQPTTAPAPAATTAPVQQSQAKGTTSCTGGAVVQIADDGSVWMPNGNPKDAYECDFTPSQTKQLYWKGTNAELSIAGKGVLIPMHANDQWIQIIAGTTYHVRGSGGNGGFALQIGQT